MDKSDYISKIKDLLNSSKFTPLKTNIFKHVLHIEDKINHFLRSLKQNNLLPNQYPSFHTSGTVPGVLYWLPKTHKTNLPIRPILAGINSPNYKLAKFVVPLQRLFRFHITYQWTPRPDKGQGVVFMDKSDYISKIKGLLNSSKFSPLKTNIFKHVLHIEDKINHFLRSLKQNNLLPNQYPSFHTSGTVPGVLYWLPKTHKTNLPIRPILAGINSPNYKLAKFVVPLQRLFRFHITYQWTKFWTLFYDFFWRRIPIQ